MGLKGKEMYYGEIRVRHSCELRHEMMVTQPVHFGINFVNLTVNPPSRCSSLRRDGVLEFECPDFGQVFCFQPTNQSLYRCFGLVRASNTEHRYVCTGIALAPTTHQGKQNGSNIAYCSSVHGIHRFDSAWITGREFPWNFQKLRNTIDIVYGSGENVCSYV